MAARTSTEGIGHGDMRAIGRKLNVAYVLEGSLRREGQRVRVTAQLIIVYVIVVKRTLPLDVELEDEVRKGEEVLDRAEKAADQLELHLPSIRANAETATDHPVPPKASGKKSTGEAATTGRRLRIARGM